MRTLKRNTCLLVWMALTPSTLLASEPLQPSELLPPPKLAPFQRGEEVAPSLRQDSPDRSIELPPAPSVAPPLPASPTAPTTRPAEAVLRPGEAVTLRIRQVLPADGLSPGERLLNSRAAVRAGDHFLAEIIKPACAPPALIGGSVAKEVRPGWFGRPGYVTLELSQIVETVDGQARFVPWQVDLADRGATSRTRRALTTALLGLEGAIVGASIGAQNPNSPSSGAAVAGGAGVGLLLGVGYASFQRGREASLEPGDTFDIVVGAMSYRPLPQDLQTILYPAGDPGQPPKKK